MKRVVLVVLLLVTFLNNIHAQGMWSNLGHGIYGGYGVYALCADTNSNILYAGGDFDTTGLIHQNSLAKWNGSEWDTTASILSGTYVYALIMYQGNLIIGFSDGTIGQYDGSTLTHLPGFNESVYCFYIYNDTLYAGGKFTHSGSTTLNCIAKWSGTKWLPVDSGVSWIDCCPEVASLTKYNGDLIATGTFDHAGNVSTTGIAAYNGGKWSSLNVNLSDFGSTPYNSSLEVFKNKLYVLGLFDSVNSVYNIGGAATWDGTNWDTVFSNTDNSIVSAPNSGMKSFNGSLFVSGRYNNQVPYQYDGNKISTVDSGVGGYIYSMTAWNGSLYVGGSFNFAIEARPHTPWIARWTPDTPTSIKQVAKDNEGVSVYPNPFSEETTLQFLQPLKGNSQLTISDLTGRIVENYPLQNGTTKFMIQGNNLSPAMYFYRLTLESGQEYVGKIILIK